MIRIRLKNILGAQLITQAEFSRRTGIRLPTISDLCNNKSKQIRLEVIDKICSELGCTPGELFVFQEDEV